MLQLARSSKYLLTKKFDLFMHTELYRMQSTCSQSELFFYVFENMRHESEAAGENNANMKENTAILTVN